MQRWACPDISTASGSRDSALGRRFSTLQNRTCECVREPCTMSKVLIRFSDELGVKLGHRRVRKGMPGICASLAHLRCKRLQRRISTDRGIPLSVPIPSIYPLSKKPKTDSFYRKPSGALDTRECRGVAKRKYRRHPKVCCGSYHHIRASSTGG